MGTGLGDAGRSSETVWQLDVLQSGERTADDLMRHLDHPLEPQSLCFSTLGEPHCDVGGQDIFNGRTVEVYQQLLVYVVLPKPPRPGSTSTAVPSWLQSWC